MVRLRVIAWVVGCLLAGCGEDSNAAGPTDVRDAQVSNSPSQFTNNPGSDASYTFPCLGAPEKTNEATFTSVYLDVFCKASCTNPYCHGSSGAWGELDLSSSIEGAYASLVDQRTGTSVPADGRATCRQSDRLRVVPGSPEQSLLFLKITGNTPCGTVMPPPESAFSLLTAEQIDQIRRWIEAGAPLHRAASSPDSEAGFDAGGDAAL